MNDLADFAACLERAAALAEKQPPCMSLLIDEEGLCVDLVLDTKRATISEWIKGEGADICLYRDRDTGKVVGCHLPLYQKELRVSRIEKPKSKGRNVMPKPEKAVHEDTNEYSTTLPGLRCMKNGEPMFIAGDMSWPDCPYAAVVAAQYHQWKTLGHFVDGGIALAVEKGQEDILRLLGVPVPGDEE